MIKLFLKHHCPGCNKRLFKPVKGFLGNVTAHDAACRSRLKNIAEHQFALWQYTPAQLKRLYYTQARTLTQLGIPTEQAQYTDFIIWLFITHGSTRQTLDRIYNGLMEGNNV